MASSICQFYFRDDHISHTLLQRSSCSRKTAVLCLGSNWQQLGTMLLSEFSSLFWNVILLEIPRSLNPAKYTTGCKIAISAFNRKLKSHDIYSFGPCQFSSRPCKGLELAAINGWKTRWCSPSTWNEQHCFILERPWQEARVTGAPEIKTRIKLLPTLATAVLLTRKKG